MKGATKAAPRAAVAAVASPVIALSHAVPPATTLLAKTTAAMTSTRPQVWSSAGTLATPSATTAV